MSSVKLCENCLHDIKTPQESPCLECRKGSGWESKQNGCEFCNYEETIKIGDIEISIFGIDSRKNLTVDVTDVHCKPHEAVNEESFKINYCPMCGKILGREVL